MSWWWCNSRVHPRPIPHCRRPGPRFSAVSLGSVPSSRVLVFSLWFWYSCRCFLPCSCSPWWWGKQSKPFAQVRRLPLKRVIRMIYELYAAKVTMEAAWDGKGDLPPSLQVRLCCWCKQLVMMVTHEWLMVFAESVFGVHGEAVLPCGACGLGRRFGCAVYPGPVL